MRDILNQPNHVFSGKTVRLGGDFRQTLPVKRENMHLNNKSLSEIDNHRTSGFAQWLLHIGNGEIGIPDDFDLENTSWVNIPDEYCIPNDDNDIKNMINFIYDDDTLHYPSAQKLQEKAAIPHGHDGGEVELLYPREYLNSLSFAGLPPHKLTLKVGSPIMLLRNINITSGLCNGMRLIVSQLLPKVIEA
nr:DNA helicase [Tanacetum cinerariifolium]